MFNKTLWQREYRKTPKGKMVSYLGHKKYMKNHPEKRKEIRERHYSKYPWKEHYKNARSRCVSKNAKYYQKGIKFNMTMGDFKELWFRDKAWLLKRPSIDRKKNHIGYIKSNCRFIELSLNSSIRTPICKLKESEVIKIRELRFEGKLFREIANIFKISEGYTWQLCNGKRRINI